MLLINITPFAFKSVTNEKRTNLEYTSTFSHRGHGQSWVLNVKLHHKAALNNSAEFSAL